MPSILKTWHILRPIQKSSPMGSDVIQENLIWINNTLRDVLNLNINIPLTTKLVPRRKSFSQQKQQSTLDEVEGDDDDTKTSNEVNVQSDCIELHKDRLSLNIYSSTFTPSTSSRCIIVCASARDLEHAQKMKITLNEIYNIPCEVRLCSIHKSIQTISKFLSNYAFEHCRPTVFVTLGNINNGLAMCLSSNSSYPVIHCSLLNVEQANNLFDSNSFLTHDTPLFTTVFTLPSAIQNVVQILAMNDWKLWTKQRGRRLKNYLDLLVADQQLTTAALATASTQQNNKANNGILTIK